MMNPAVSFFGLLLALALHEVTSFVVVPPYSSQQQAMGSSSVLRMAEEEPEKRGFFQGFSDFWKELDAFMDDASARRLGNGAAFYGKRKSNFYGEQDKNKKSSRDVFDATEDYQGPSTSGYFGWMVDEEGQWRPVSRMKKQTLDKKK